MSFREELERYDLAPGDLIETTSKNIWMLTPKGNLVGVHNGYPSSIGSYCAVDSSGFSVVQISRVLRPNWTYMDYQETDSVRRVMYLKELQPKPKKKQVTIEVDADRAPVLGEELSLLCACSEPWRELE